MTLQLINLDGLPASPTCTHVVATGTTMVFIAGQEPARLGLFGDHKPADTVVGVETLARPESLIEVDAVAVTGG